MELIRWRRVRWAVRATLILGVAASVAANILHARDNLISQTIAAWPPLALLLTVELISRVPVHRRVLAAARLLSTATIAGIAGWVSYWHMVGVASKYGEVGASPFLLPLSVDGLIVVASICLVELSGRINTAQARPSPTAAAGPTLTAGHSTPPVAVSAAPRSVPDPARTDPHPDLPVVSGSAAATVAPDPDTRAEDSHPNPDTDPGTDGPVPGRVRTPVGAGSRRRPAGAATTTATPARPSPGTNDRTPGRIPAPRPDTTDTDPDTVGAGRRQARTPVGAAAPASPRLPTPATTALAASRAPARHSTTTLAYALDIDPDSELAHLSLRERVFWLLDREIDAADTRRPTAIADTLLPRLGTVDRETIARYVRIWRTAVTTGRRNPTGRLRSVPPRQPTRSNPAGPSGSVIGVSSPEPAA